MSAASHLFACHPVAPIRISKASSNYLFDSNGRKFIDFEAGIWCAGLGHNHPDITRCIGEQSRKITHLGSQFIADITETAAGALLSRTSLVGGKVVFLSSGSEAMELSFRMATEFTGRSRMITFSRSYLGAYGRAAGRTDERGWGEIDIDSCLTCEADECSPSCSHLAELHPETAAAFVLEPVLGSGGILIPPSGVVKYLAGEIQSTGGLVIADEVTTGLGRTGRWLGSEHHDISPDIIAFGKMLGNGYPVSAVVMRTDIAAVLEQHEFYHVQSHQNDPLGCAVAGEVITTLEREKLIDRSRRIGEFFLDRLHAMRPGCPAISDIRGYGLMLGVGLDRARAESEKTVKTVVSAMLERGFVIGAKPALALLRFMPPLTIGEDDILEMCDSFESVLRDITGG